MGKPSKKNPFDWLSEKRILFVTIYWPAVNKNTGDRFDQLAIC
jgi:hypothetical protein